MPLMTDKDTIWSPWLCNINIVPNFGSHRTEVKTRLIKLEDTIWKIQKRLDKKKVSWPKNLQQFSNVNNKIFLELSLIVNVASLS